MREEDDLREFEAELRSLRPVSGAADPVAAAFAGGQRMEWRLVRRWQGAAAVALVFAVAVHLPRPEKASSPKLPQPLAGASEFIEPAQSDQSLQVLQQMVYERGIDALPQVRLPPSRASGVKDTL